MDKKYNIVGKVRKPHGVKGEVKVEANTRYLDERFKIGSTLYYKENNEYKELKIINRRGTDDNLIIAFEGFNSPESLFPILNKVLYGLKDKSILKEGDHFYSSYKGAKVVQDEIEKGIVTNIIPFPSGDYLVIKTDDGEKYVPLLDEFIDHLDEENNMLYLKPYEGLLWLNSIY